ncbi:MAG TPA: alpha/beta hydrolase [Terriglobales bacterium]|nr:alpha/beta hydrolase [Terriglobales bacterium]
MPKVSANNLTFNYEQQGSGEPLILIPFLSADNACYAFQVAEYSKHFTCISLDLRGTGESDKPDTPYTTETLADDVAAFMRALDIPKAHISGLSLGAAVGIWLAAKHPELVQSLSLHSGWHKTDAFVKAFIESLQIVAKALNSVPETTIRAIFPWCLTPELYASKPEYVESLAAFVRSRPAQSVPSFLLQSNAVLTHDADAQLSGIAAPTLITFGRHDMVTSLRFAEPMTQKIRNSELVVFESSSHAPIYEQVEEFNSKALDFLRRHARPAAASTLGAA